MFNDFPENQLFVSYQRSDVKTACKKMAADREGGVGGGPPPMVQAAQWIIRPCRK